MPVVSQKYIIVTRDNKSCCLLMTGIDDQHPGGCVLDNNLLESFRERLLQSQAELSALQDTGDEAARVVELDQTSVGRLSRMDALQGQAMSRERGRRRSLELEKIAAALRRIDAGDYGYCLDCDEPIAVQRLALDPAVTLCIDCASARESG
jgi:DnaK suppressor protein